jgi:hypothetical protein
MLHTVVNVFMLSSQTGLFPPSSTKLDSEHSMYRSG